MPLACGSSSAASFWLASRICLSSLSPLPAPAPISPGPRTAARSCAETPRCRAEAGREGRSAQICHEVSFVRQSAPPRPIQRPGALLDRSTWRGRSGVSNPPCPAIGRCKSPLRERCRQRSQFRRPPAQPRAQTRDDRQPTFRQPDQSGPRTLPSVPAASSGGNCAKLWIAPVAAQPSPSPAGLDERIEPGRIVEQARPDIDHEPSPGSASSTSSCTSRRNSAARRFVQPADHRLALDHRETVAREGRAEREGARGHPLAARQWQATVTGRRRHRNRTRPQRQPPRAANSIHVRSSLSTVEGTLPDRPAWLQPSSRAGPFPHCRPTSLRADRHRPGRPRRWRRARRQTGEVLR